MHAPTGARPIAHARALLIRHARLVDGTGSPWRLGDVLIAGDCIAAIGSLPGATARDTIGATGLVVAPAFIDMLGRSEYPLLRDGRATPRSRRESRARSRARSRASPR
jgi:N-acyl-D-aspartate/D-glutamate deacylase